MGQSALSLLVSWSPPDDVPAPDPVVAPSATAESVRGLELVGQLAPAMTPPGIKFSVEQRPYRLGDTITMVLANESDRFGHTQLCAITMEREGAEGWERVPRRSPNRLPLLCPDMAIALPPGRSFVMSQPVIPEMEAGVYRFRGDADRGEVKTVLITNEFRVFR